MRKQDASNPYATSLRKLNVGQVATFNRSARAEVATEVKRMNAEQDAYEFKQNIGKTDIKVTRVVPTNLFNRSKYIDSINKDALTNALDSTNWSKEGAARVFGISARTIGRLIGERGVKVRRSPSTTTKKANKSTTKANKTNSKAKRTR